jgi:hypothetical protein
MTDGAALCGAFQVDINAADESRRHFCAGDLQEGREELE